MMDTFVPSEAQQFPWNAVFQQHEASLHIKGHICSLMHEMFPSLRIVAYGLTV